MSSVSWARAPTRRASAETAACSRPRAAFSFARSDWTAARTPATRARTRSTAAPPSTIRSRRISRACARARSAALRSSASARPRAASRNSPLGLGEGGVRVGAPVQRPGQPDAAVELAVGAAEGVPGVGGGREVVPDPLALDVVVEPAAEPGPGAGERLVGDLEDAVVAGDQPGGRAARRARPARGRWRPAGAAPGCGPVRLRCRGRPGGAPGRAAACAVGLDSP